MRHSAMSWTACYDPLCATHLSEKEGSGWFPKKTRQPKHSPRNGPAEDRANKRRDALGKYKKKESERESRGPRPSKN